MWLMQVRPGTEDDDDLDETIQTCILSDVNAGSSPSPPPPTDTQPSQELPRKDSSSRKSSNEADPDASLITDYQLITDIRVSMYTYMYSTYM